MDTSDDDLQPEPLADEGIGSGMADEPFDGLEPPPVVPGPGAKRLVLAILASIALAAGGVALWAGVYAIREREYIGIAVLIGLLVGYVMRAVSGRTTIVVRLIAGLVTAIACVCGTVVGEAAYVAAKYDSKFWKLLGDIEPKWWSILRHRNALTFAVYAAAVVIAFLAAGPQKPKKVKTVPDVPDALDDEARTDDAVADDAEPVGDE